MPVTVYIILLAVIVVLLLGSTWVLNRATHPSGGEVAAARSLEASDAGIAAWARDTLASGFTPDHLTSLLLLLAGDQAERGANGVSIKGTKLALLPVPGYRGWRGTIALDPSECPLEIQLDCRRDEAGFSIDASLIPQVDGRGDGKAHGVALIVNPPNAESFLLELDSRSESPRWQSQHEGRRSFTLSNDEVERLRSLVQRLVVP
jgi:hypothetical protein